MAYSREDVVKALKTGLFIGAGLGAAYATKRFLDAMAHESEMIFLQDYQTSKGEWELYTGSLSLENRKTIKRAHVKAWEQYAFSKKFNIACKTPGRFFYIFKKGEPEIYTCLRTIMVRYESSLDSEPIKDWIKTVLPGSANELTSNGEFTAFGSGDSAMIAFYDLTTPKEKEGKGAANAMISAMKQRLSDNETIKHIITISPENAVPLHTIYNAEEIAVIKDMRKGHKYPDAHIMCYK